MRRPELTETQQHDVTWIGSRFFLTPPGYYDTYHSNTPREGWPYNSSRDAGLAQVPSGAGYPTCKQWWSDGHGLRARLLTQVDPSLLSRLASWVGFMSRTDVDDSVIRAIAAPRQQKLNQGATYTDYGGQIDKTVPNVVTRAVSDVGLAVGATVAFPSMDAMRQALPMALSLLKMALVICIPMVLLVGTYDLKFQLARWIDSTILDALYGWGWVWNRPVTNFDPVMGLNDAFGDLLLNFVMGTMFIVLPSVWVTALGWAGIRVGNTVQLLTMGSEGAKSAGGQGFGTLFKAGKR